MILAVYSDGSLNELWSIIKVVKENTTRSFKYIVLYYNKENRIGTCGTHHESLTEYIKNENIRVILESEIHELKAGLL